MGAHLRAILILCSSAISFYFSPDWGFYAHKELNKQAVYSLPYPLRQYLIDHIEYLSIHAVDADKRRYAHRNEAFQHFFDTEKWQPCPDSSIFYNRRDLARCSGSWVKVVQGDTIELDSSEMVSLCDGLPTYFCGSEWQADGVLFVDTMANHGLLPIRIINRYNALVKAYMDRSKDDILSLMSDLGHYIGDAHVPLHTTVNYNGQLTGQDGIHAFWETSIPELLLKDSFDLFVGRAEYLEDVRSTTWNMIRSSYEKVDSVLYIEKELRANWPEYDQICPVLRNGQPQFLPCPEFIRAYSSEMNGMVERQFRKCVVAIASFWWSAYVDAGQPRLHTLKESATQEYTGPEEHGSAPRRCD